MSTGEAVFVTVEIKEDMITEFLEVMNEDAIESRKEDGCLRFDLLKDKEQANKFHFYEAYTSADALAVHKETPHYKKWAAFKEKGGVLSQVLDALHSGTHGRGSDVVGCAQNLAGAQICLANPWPSATVLPFALPQVAVKANGVSKF